MKLQTVITTLIIASVNTTGRGQVVSNLEHIESGASLTNYSMIGKTLPPPQKDTNVYLFDDWKKFDIRLKGGKILKDFYINLNLIDHNIELLQKDEIKVLSVDLIRSLSSAEADSEYINIDEVSNQPNLRGFMQVMVSGNIAVYQRDYIYTRQPTYVEGVGVGDRNYKNFKLKEYFVFDGKSLSKFTKSKKENIRYFEGEKKSTEYIKSNKIKLNKIEGFVKAAEHYNGIAGNP